MLRTAPLRTYPPAAMDTSDLFQRRWRHCRPASFWTLRQRSQVSLWILLLMIGRWCLWVFYYALWSFMKFLQPIFGHPSFCSFVSTKLFSPKKTLHHPHRIFMLQIPRRSGLRSSHRTSLTTPHHFDEESPMTTEAPFLNMNSTYCKKEENIITIKLIMERL